MYVNGVVNRGAGLWQHRFLVFCRGGGGCFGRDDRVGDGVERRGGQGGRGVVGFGFRRGVVAVQVAEVAAVRFDDEGAAAEAVAVGVEAAPVAVEVEVGAVGGRVLFGGGGVGFAAHDVGFFACFGQQFCRFAFGSGADDRGFFLSARAEVFGDALAFGAHPVEDAVADFVGEVHPFQAHAEDFDAVAAFCLAGDAAAGGVHDGTPVLRDGFFDGALHEFAAQVFFDHVVQQAACLVKVALDAGVEGADVLDAPFDEVVHDEPFFFVGHEAFGFNVQALDAGVKAFDVLHEGDFEFEAGFVVGADQARELGDDGDLPFVDDVGAAGEGDEGDHDGRDEGVGFLVHAGFLALAAAAAFVAAAVGGRGAGGNGCGCGGLDGGGAVVCRAVVVLEGGQGGGCRGAAEVEDGAGVVGIDQHFVAVRVDASHGVKVEAFAHDFGVFAVGGEQVVEAAAVGSGAGEGFGFVGLRGL